MIDQFHNKYIYIFFPSIYFGLLTSKVDVEIPTIFFILILLNTYIQFFVIFWVSLYLFCR